MNSNEMKHITSCLEKDKRITLMCGLGKLHKGNIFPPTYRLLVASVGSPLHGIRRWVDIHLKELLPFCKMCINNSDDALKILKDLKIVHDDVFVTNCDSEVMYPNINAEEGLVVVMTAMD